MDNSFEAIYTGVYVFVFISSLTIALYLFNGINELADNAYEYGKLMETSAVIETDSVEDKYLTKEDVISYYFNYIKKDNYEDAPSDGFTFSIEGISETNLSYSSLISRLASDKYILVKTASGFKIQTL